MRARESLLLLVLAAWCGVSATAQEGPAASAMVVTVESAAAGPVRFAAEELAKYLEAATGKAVTEQSLAGHSSGAQGIRVGEAVCFPEIVLPTVPDAALDDAVYIEVRQGAGTIAGNNPRATLRAVYRYLDAIGFRWVRPGADGELIPALTALPDVSISETASYRHRGVCIEGINSAEHVRALIDWLPKLGFNSYFIQFEQAYTFFDRWYTHDLNPNLKGAHPSVEQAQGYVEQIEQDVRKRGMLYHKVGHGWTCLPFGVQALGWEKSKEPAPPEITPFLAEIRGVRKFNDDEPLCTNLCYSNPEVRRRMCAFIADYAQKHPIVDYLHVWLADGWNNHCECAPCRTKRPSDWYVTLLNELDGELSGRGLKTRIVFLMYVDLLWPPEQARLAHPDRFALMFAPYTRSYNEPYRAGKVNLALPPFALNKLEMPKSVEANVAFLQAWQEQFQGDGFDYDYHFFEQYANMGQMGLARVIYEDMKNLKELGLNGNISCQPQRTFFPTGLLMTIMGRTLWNRAAGYDAIADDYFRSAFGAEGPACRQYFESLTALYHPEALRRNGPDAQKHIADMRRIPALIADFAPVVARNEYLEDPCQARSWQVLRDHAEFTRLHMDAVFLKTEGKAEAAAESWKKAEQFLWDHEPGLQTIFDVCGFVENARQPFVAKNNEKDQ